MHARRPAPSARALTGLLLAAALALTGCGASGGDDSGTAARQAAPQDAARGEGPAAGAPGYSGAEASDGTADGKPAAAPTAVSTSHIVRTASLTVRVKDVSKALDTARRSAVDAGGYVGDETTTRDRDGDERTRVVLRVPVERYDAVLGELQGAGTLLERRAKAEDVTDQVVDVDSRVRSQRASVARVRELMDQATRLSDVVSLEGELSTRQAELEALLARQASLKNRTSLATITLSLTENTPARADEGEDKDDTPGFVDALKDGWGAFVTMLRWLAVVIGAVLPFAALAALLALLWLRVLRPRLRRTAAPVPAPRTPGAAGAQDAPGTPGATVPAAVPTAPGGLPSAPPVPPAGPGERPGGRG